MNQAYVCRTVGMYDNLMSDVPAHPNPPEGTKKQPCLELLRLTVSSLRGFLTVFLLVFLAGCGTIPQDLRQSLVTVVPHDVDFEELEYYAERSRAAYDSPSEIRKQFPNTTRVKTVQPVDVQYFLETDTQQKTQTITIRGTSNKANRLEDIDIEKVPDPVLGINLHKGFREDALALQADVTPHLRKDYTIRVTGHSLGGAVAAIKAHLLFADGYNVNRLVTFGGPKLTDAEGKAAIEDGIDVTRVVNEADIVPTVPPAGLSAGGYQHFGPEVILRPGRQYVWLPGHDANRLSIGDLWRNLDFLTVDAHSMDEYLPNLREKVAKGATQVPYYSSSFAGG
jgi:hypothetical protein